MLQIVCPFELCLADQLDNLLRILVVTGVVEHAVVNLFLQVLFTRNASLIFTLELVVILLLGLLKLLDLLAEIPGHIDQIHQNTDLLLHRVHLGFLLAELIFISLSCSVLLLDFVQKTLHSFSDQFAHIVHLHILVLGVLYFLFADFVGDPLLFDLGAEWAFRRKGIIFILGLIDLRKHVLVRLVQVEDDSPLLMQRFFCFPQNLLLLRNFGVSGR